MSELLSRSRVEKRPSEVASDMDDGCPKRRFFACQEAEAWRTVVCLQDTVVWEAPGYRGSRSTHGGTKLNRAAFAASHAFVGSTALLPSKISIVLHAGGRRTLATFSVRQIELEANHASGQVWGSPNNPPTDERAPRFGFAQIWACVRDGRIVIGFLLDFHKSQKACPGIYSIALEFPPRAGLPPLETSTFECVTKFNHLKAIDDVYFFDLHEVHRTLKATVFAEQVVEAVPPNFVRTTIQLLKDIGDSRLVALPQSEPIEDDFAFDVEETGLLADQESAAPIDWAEIFSPMREDELAVDRDDGDGATAYDPTSDDEDSY